VNPWPATRFYTGLFMLVYGIITGGQV
jgi:hypothetical protein